MSHTSMATVSSSSGTGTASTTAHNHERLNFETIRTLVDTINQHVVGFIEDPQARKRLQLRCTSKLKIKKQEYFEFSEHSVLSNLYWGILNLESAIQSKNSEESITRLKSTEKMLQVPALLSERGRTAGIRNRFLICCSYFYLSLVRNLQKDEWQTTLHFLQALLVCPRLVRMEFIPEICESIFLPQYTSENRARGELRGAELESFDNFSSDEMMKQQARRYKSWLMYYQIMSYGESTQLRRNHQLAPSQEDETQTFNPAGGHHRSPCKESSSMPINSTSSKHSNLAEDGNCWTKFHNGTQLHPPHYHEHIIDETADMARASTLTAKQTSPPHEDSARTISVNWDEIYNRDTERSLQIKNIQDMLEESQSSSSIHSLNDFPEEGDASEAELDDIQSSLRIIKEEEDDTQSETTDWEVQATCSVSSPACTGKASEEASRCSMHEDACEGYSSYMFSSTSLSSVSDINLSISELKKMDSNSFYNLHGEGRETLKISEHHSFRLFDHLQSKALKGKTLTHVGDLKNSARHKQESNTRESIDAVSLHPGKEVQMEIQWISEKRVSTLCLSDKIEKCEEDDDSVELTTMQEAEVKFEQLRNATLDQLLNIISTSKEERVIRVVVSVLLTMIAENKTVIEDIKRKGLRLCNLVTALKCNVHDAATLIYLISPSPKEIKGFELLPQLLKVACNSSSYKDDFIQPALTPREAALLMIEVLVTAFDSATNNIHLAAISSSQVLSELAHVARYSNIKEISSLAAVLVKCMQFDGKCRSLISNCTPMDPFVHLLRSRDKRAECAALQFFHEILCMPRSSAISLLNQIRQPDSINTMNILMSCIQQSEPEYRLMAANLLLQLHMLEDSSDKSIFREVAMEVVLGLITSEESSNAQILSANILSNLGGTYAWTGEPYTVARLVTKAGLKSFHHKNMIRNFDWSEQILEDTSIDEWSRKIARSIITKGEPLFRALEKGLSSKIKSVSRDCLIAIAWIGCEIAAKTPQKLRYTACEILLSGIEKFLHPGSDLEERLLACLCVYNYASGKGMQKLIPFSEGVRESLRRLSNISWMAEELLNVTDYFLQTKSRISCVHTQVLEMGQNCNEAVNALIYYKGQLYSGHSNGSIKVWDINKQRAKLVWDVKEHHKEVTCFALFEPEGSLLSGSSDKTIRVWKMVNQKLECIEVISTTEPIHKIETCGQQIFLITESRGLKVFDESRTAKIICKNKQVKCLTVTQRKLYLGCTDSSIQEVDVPNDQHRELKSPAKRWLKQKKPANSVVVYRDWLYVASSIVEGSSFKEWRRQIEPQMSIAVGKGENVKIMGVVEDFIYLTCSSSPSILQIWLRGTEQKVGRLSAGSRITSLLTANDVVICGTETGLIKGWIPF
ncbi:hypothetical protein MKW98_004817 [Papaver atlanticum]|uniref:E3 ubiquitin-protein ligase LIN-1 n=1 Tax=Papaver atlanticum TaxID=357466 RepID=A0AAD4XDG3_9MAGN|nr:hypothetical protein MKW98_004817 [Papaver atlanticum]